jgi:predicted nucleic acid-binding protein
LRVLLDTNVVLDVLAARQPWVADSSAVLSLAEAGKAEGYVAVHTVTTLHYLLCKHLDRSRAAAAILDLLRFVTVATASHASVLEALSLGWSDFEDALQGVSALAVGADYIVTRDPEDFGDIGIPPVAPGEFLALVGAAG